MLRWILTLVTILLPASLFADGLIIIERLPHIIPGHFPFAPLEVGYHRVNVKIDAQVAVTTVDQEFINPGSAQLEGTYLFPLPPGSHIDKFAMDIDGKMADAELLSADKATSIYEEIVRRHRDPALLEYVGRDAFKVRVFPIEPHSRKHIKIRYTQILRSDGGLVEYVYPLNTEKFSSKPIGDVSVKVELEAKRPLKSVYCPSHSAEVKRDGDKRAVIGWEERNVRPDTDFKVVFSTGNDGIGMDLLSYRDDREGEGEGFFMLLPSPGMVRAGGPAPAKDICFVLDTSGSMAQNGKLEQAKKAMEFCLANLNEQDHFQIIRFSTESEPLFDSLQPADAHHLSKAREFVHNLKPIGGTAIGDALTQALKARPSSDSSRPYVMVFMTDGLPTVGETDEDRLVARATHSAAPRIFTFGVGTDVNTHLLDRIAQDTRGSSQYVLPNEDLEVKLSSFYTKIKEPALTNLRLEMNGVSLQQVYPKELPDLFYGEQLIVMGKYKTERGSLRTAVKLSGTMAGRDIVVAEDVELPERDTRYEFVPRLWATRRVGWLLDEIRMHGESGELKDEVTQLARRYGIVTPYTAYLILEDEDRRHVPMGMRSMRQIEESRAMRDDAFGFYGSAKAEAAGGGRGGMGGGAMGGGGMGARSGARAVNNAQRLGDMKGSWNTSQSVQAMPSAVAASPAPAEQGYRTQQAASGQNLRVVNGRAFYQNGNVWVDGTAQTQKGLKQQQIKLGSDEYFALVSANREAAPWLSLGTEVDVVIGDTLYQIR